MADQKISQLTGGGAAQATDEYVVARSGGNNKITGANVAAAATSVGTLSSLTVSGNANLATTSGSVGIGNTNPATTLEVSGDMTIRKDTGVLYFRNAAASAYSAYIQATASTDLIIATNQNIPMKFRTNDTERMVLDTSGNLGLGVTPSAWETASSKALQFTGGSIWSFSTSQLNLLQNAFYNTSGNLTYINNAAASAYRQISGAHSWYTAGAGTGTISFTQAMTLDASGNLGVRVVPSAWEAGKAIQFGTYGAVSSSLQAGVNTQLTNNVYFDGTNYRYIASQEAFSIQLNRDVITFSNAAAGSGGNTISFTERARITSGGYFKASNNATYIDATGGYHEFRSTGANATVYTSNTHASDPYGIRVHYTAATPNNTDNWFLYCNDNTAVRAYIRSNGGLTNYQANNTDLSDARTKTDITPAASMWDKVAALEIVTYKYTDQTHDDVNVGVIAQQVETVEPVWVDTDGFGETPEGEEPLKTVYTKDITFAAIKALQEAMARIEALEVEVAALKAGA